MPLDMHFNVNFFTFMNAFNQTTITCRLDINTHVAPHFHLIYNVLLYRKKMHKKNAYIKIIFQIPFTGPRLHEPDLTRNRIIVGIVGNFVARINPQTISHLLTGPGFYEPGPSTHAGLHDHRGSQRWFIRHVPRPEFSTTFRLVNGLRT